MTQGGVVTQSDNKSPYPYSLTSSNSNFDMTNNGDGTYRITKKAASGELFMTASCNLPAGTYTYTYIVDGTNTTNGAWIKLTGGGTTSYQAMTRSVQNGKTYYTKTLTATSAVTAILIDIQSNSGYAASGWSGDVAVVVSAGSTSKDFTSPVGARMGIQSAYSVIKQTADSVSTKVEKNGVISAINQSSESVTINAGKINLSGYVTVSSLGSSGTVEIYGGRIKGGTITLGGSNNGNGQLSIVNASNQTLLSANNSNFTYYCRSSTSSFLIKNNSGYNLLEANTNGLVVYCRSSSAGLYLKDSSGNTIMAANSGGIMLYKGTIQGPSIIVGGYNNTNGSIIVKSASSSNSSSGGDIIIEDGAEDVVTLDKNGITTTSLTATQYIYCNGNSSSYFKIPFFSSQGYLELSANNGMKIYSYGSTIYFDSAGAFSVTRSNKYTSITGDVIDTGTVLFKDEVSGAYGSEISAPYAYFVDMDVESGKGRVVTTKDFDTRRLYAFESPTPMFFDVGTSTIDEYGSCYVFIDPIFAETIETKDEYQVILQKYGSGDCWVSERRANYFIISGTPGLSFCWEIHAKQIDIDQERMPIAVKGDGAVMTRMLKSNYDEKAADYIEKYYSSLHTIEMNEGSSA